MSGVPAPNRLQIGLALAAVYLIWGSTYLAIRLALPSYPPVYLAGLRFFVAGALLFGLLRLQGERPPTLRQWINGGRIGLLMVAANALVAFGEQTVASGVTALSVACVPLWVALFSGFWGRWPNRREWIGLFIGLSGLVLLNLRGDLKATPLGAAALVGSTLCWSLGSTWGRRLEMPKHLMAPAAQMLIGGAVVLLVGMAMGQHPASPIQPTASAALIYLIVFGSIVAFSAFDFLLSHLRPALATSNAYVNPVVAVVLGVAVAGERVTAVTIAAMLVILLGVGVIAWSPAVSEGAVTSDETANEKARERV